MRDSIASSEGLAAQTSQLSDGLADRVTHVHSHLEQTILAISKANASNHENVDGRLKHIEQNIAGWDQRPQQAIPQAALMLDPVLPCWSSTASTGTVPDRACIGDQPF